MQSLFFVKFIFENEELHKQVDQNTMRICTASVHSGKIFGDPFFLQKS